jgi:hypothetical protein
MRQTVTMACVLCGSLKNPTDEDVIPKWLLRAFHVEGSVTVNTREEAGDPHEVRRLRHFQITLDGGLCKKCNNELLGGLEQVVQPILEPMAVRREPTTLDLASQRLLAVWAIKTVYLLELAICQRYSGTRLVEGYQPSSSERAGCWPSLSSGAPNLLSPRGTRRYGSRAGTAWHRAP